MAILDVGGESTLVDDLVAHSYHLALGYLAKNMSVSHLARLSILSEPGSDLGPVSRVKELLRGSKTRCQYR